MKMMYMSEKSKMIITYFQLQSYENKFHYENNNN